MNRFQSRIAVLLAMLISCSLTVAAASSGKSRYALVIGNGEYQTMTRLANPVNDATDIATELVGFGFNVDLVTNATLGEMTRSVNQFVSTISRTQDVEAALFYYAGHGVQYDGSNYLIPVNMEIRASYELLDKALGMDSVVRGLEASQSAFNLVILDACRDNPFSVTRGGDRGLSVMTTAKHGSMLVFATSPGDVAQDGVGRNSPFTDALLEAIRLPGVEIRPLITSVQRMVQERTGGKQVPWMNTSYTGEFYFQTVEEQLARSQEQLDGLQAELAILEREIAQREGAIKTAKSSEERRRLEAEQATSKALEAAKQLETQRVLEMERQAQAILESDAAQVALKREMDSRLSSQEVALRQEAAARRAELEALRVSQSVGSLSLMDRLETIAQYNRSITEIRGRYEELVRGTLADLDTLNLLKINAFKAENPRDPWESVSEHAQRIQERVNVFDRENVRAKNEQKTQFENRLTQELETIAGLLDSVRRELDGMLFEVPMEGVRVFFSHFDTERKVFQMHVQVETEFGTFVHPITFNIANSDRETLKNEYYRVYSADQSGALVGRVVYRIFEGSDGQWILLLNDLEVLSLLEGGGVLATRWQDDTLRIEAPVCIFSVRDTVQKSDRLAGSHNLFLSGSTAQNVISIDGVEQSVPAGGVFKGTVKTSDNAVHYIEVMNPWLSDIILFSVRLKSSPWNDTVMYADVSRIGERVGLLSIPRIDLDVRLSLSTNETVDIPMEFSSAGYSARLVPGSYVVKARLRGDPEFVYSMTTMVRGCERTLLDPGPVRFSLQYQLELAMKELEEQRQAKSSRTFGKVVGWSAVGIAAAGIVGSAVSYLLYNEAVQNYQDSKITDDLIRYRQNATQMGALFTASVITGIAGGIGGGTILGLDFPKSNALKHRISELEKTISSLKSQIAAARAREAMDEALGERGEGAIGMVDPNIGLKTTVTLWYSLDGGQMVEPHEKTHASGTRIGTLPRPNKPGHRFDGWWTSLGPEGVEVNANTLIPSGNSYVMYAKWVEL